MLVVFEQACAAGKVTAAGTTTASLTNNACTDCAAGKYITVTNGATAATCIDCSKGKYGNTGTGSTADCSSLCAAGKYGTVAGATTLSAAGCTDCPAGKFHGSQGVSACTECPAGSWSAGTGKTSIATCSPCLDSESLLLPNATMGTIAVGNWAPAGSTSMSACINTKSATCTNVPLGSVMMFNEYFTCKSSAKPSCKADEEVLGGKADAATCTKCEGDYVKCRMDATFDIKLYMTKVEFTAGQTKFIKAIADSMSVYTANVTLVSVTGGATHIMSKQTTVKVKVSLGKKKDAKTGGGDSANPNFNPTSIQNNLITAGFTMAATKGPGQEVGGAVRTASIASLGLYDVGTMLGFELPEYTAIKGILDAATAFKVELTVQISSTKAAFTAEKEVNVCVCVRE